MSTSAPFDVQQIAGRLREIAELRQVGTAADYAAVRQLSDFPAPCAFVILAGDRGIGNPPGIAPRGQQARVRQATQVTFGVIYAARNYREQRGEQFSGEELREIIGAGRRTIIGYVPNVDGARACQFVRGDLIDYNAGVALWADVFTTQAFIGSNS